MNVSLFLLFLGCAVYAIGRLFYQVMTATHHTDLKPRSFFLLVGTAVAAIGGMVWVGP